MKNFKKALFSLLAVGAAFSLSLDTREVVRAHPGRTDASGCHTCYTNCTKWGLSYGEYHCHGGSSSSGSSVGSSSYSQDYYLQQQRIKEEQERLAQERAEAEKNLGNQEGYDYKKANPDMDMGSLSGKSESYIEGYKEGFSRAESELSENTKTLARNNASSDAKTLASPNLEVPAGVITALYLSTYQEDFTYYENLFYEEIKENAKYSAMIDVYDKYGRGDYSKEVVEKARDLYAKTYDAYYNQYSLEVEQELEYVYELGLQEGRSFGDKDYYDQQYSEYKIFNDLLDRYNRGYEDGHSLAVKKSVVLTIIVLLGIGSFLWIRKKKHRKLVTEVATGDSVIDIQELNSESILEEELDNETESFSDIDESEIIEDSNTQEVSSEDIFEEPSNIPTSKDEIVEVEEDLDEDYSEENIIKYRDEDVKPKQKKSLKLLKEGQMIQHRTYGKGKVVKIIDRKFYVDFRGKEKVFLLSSYIDRYFDLKEHKD